MTHTLHREGARESLEDDYVVLAMPAEGINREGSGDAIRAFLDLANSFETVNMGSIDVGNVYRHDFEELRDGSGDGSIVHAVFDEFDELVGFVTDLAALDTGLSIVVSGLYDRTAEACERVRTETSSETPSPHTARYGLGVRGNVERLPDGWIREITTMCGHGMVSFSLVEQMQERVSEGRMSPDEAAKRLAEPCSCGIFNRERAGRLLEAAATMPDATAD